MIDPLLTDCRRIFLRGLSRRVRIGIHDFERAAAQRILFDIDLYVPLVQTTPQCDRIDEVVDYDFVRNEVTRITERGHIDLQETLCDAVLNALLRLGMYRQLHQALPRLVIVVLETVRDGRTGPSLVA